MIAVLCLIIGLLLGTIFGFFVGVYGAYRKYEKREGAGNE